MDHWRLQLPEPHHSIGLLLSFLEDLLCLLWHLLQELRYPDVPESLHDVRLAVNPVEYHVASSRQRLDRSRSHELLHDLVYGRPR